MAGAKIYKMRKGYLQEGGYPVAETFKDRLRGGGTGEPAGARGMQDFLGGVWKQAGLQGGASQTGRGAPSRSESTRT